MLSIIVPTYNERDNIEELARRIFSCLKEADIPGELVIVDDGSPDGTADLAESLKSTYDVKVIRREGKRGLASAVIEGFEGATYDILAVMDADLSHPPEALPKMYYYTETGEAEIVIGSRFVPGGGSTNWPWYRRFVSFVARSLARSLTPVRDLTSGFFMIRRSVIAGVDLNPLGFKIGLEILAKGKYDSVKEIPIIFADRGRGKSKFSIRQVFEYLKQLWLLYRRKNH